jgi:hypothetical protein
MRHRTEPARRAGIEPIAKPLRSERGIEFGNVHPLRVRNYLLLVVLGAYAGAERKNENSQS